MGAGIAFFSNTHPIPTQSFFDVQRAGADAGLLGIRAYYVKDILATQSHFFKKAIRHRRGAWSRLFLKVRVTA
ncbi:hypothetical protein D3H35_23785 [Cohnella faecalis]|uniref:Uncharacterized protein n=1 Tax=Cohnella faecalis TaxID=2315694 RepID=A0A398CF92_9BACL|nr:hypothetical protein D3H35_23785 [Cohnella faecalis]